MNVTLINDYTGEEIATVQVSYVWDREDKFLVLIDNKNKIKYIPNTYKTNFDKTDICNLLWAYGRAIFDEQPSNVILQQNTKEKPKKVSHNDDFVSYYKKTYKVVGTKECSEKRLVY